MCGRPTGCVTARLPRPPNAIGRLVARHPLPTAATLLTPRNQPYKRDGCPGKLPSPAALQPFLPVPGQLGRRLHKAGENRRGPGAQRGSRPGAAGRSPWGRGGTGPERRAEAARGVRVAPLGLQARTPSRGPRPAPRPRPPELWLCRIPGRADPERITYPSPQRGTRPGGGARRVPSVSATLSSLPQPPRRCRRRHRRGAGGPLGSAGQ